MRALLRCIRAAFARLRVRSAPAEVVHLTLEATYHLGDR